MTTQQRKRKHRWGSAQGVVVAVRLPENVNAILESQAAGMGLPKGMYIKQVLEQELTRSRQPRQVNWLGVEV